MDNRRTVFSILRITGKPAKENVLGRLKFVTAERASLRKGICGSRQVRITGSFLTGYSIGAGGSRP